MVSVDYSDLHSILHITTTEVTAAVTEDLLDQAINLLNLYANQSISNLSGTAGSKTVTLTSKQMGAVMEVAKAIYYRSYSNQTPTTAGGITAGISPTSEPAVVAQLMGRFLTERTILRT